MTIKQKGSNKTLYQKALAVAEKYQNKLTSELTIKQFKTRVEFILIDMIFNKIEIFAVDYNNNTTYNSSIITEKSIDIIEAVLGKEQAEKLVFSIVQDKLDCLLYE